MTEYLLDPDTIQEESTMNEIGEPQPPIVEAWDDGPHHSVVDDEGNVLLRIPTRQLRTVDDADRPLAELIPSRSGDGPFTVFIVKDTHPAVFRLHEAANAVRVDIILTFLALEAGPKDTR